MLVKFRDLKCVDGMVFSMFLEFLAVLGHGGEWQCGWLVMSESSGLV